MDDSIRVSDADRDRVTAQLRDHFAAGPDHPPAKWTSDCRRR